jgi:septal ring-binding cell division protein DamX
MALDYNQKKQVNRNRPRKRPVKFFLFLILGSCISIYGLGIATGWLFLRYIPQKSSTPLASSDKTEGANPSPTPQATPKDNTAAHTKESDLTFYYTLPKGDKGVMGSGINRLHPQVAVKSANQVAAAAQRLKTLQQQTQIADKKENTALADQRKHEATTSGSEHLTSAKKEAGSESYTIQVAAYHEKSDAQMLMKKLQKIGVSARIEEYEVTGKGRWYRVRAGSKLDKYTASKLASMIGHKAILVPE